MSDTGEGFSHPDFGKEARVEVCGNEVHLVFVATDDEAAQRFAEDLVRQLMQGELHLTMMGEPTSAVEH